MSPTAKKGFSIRIFVPGGVPDGLRTVQKSNWTGCGVVCPRSVFAESKTRPEFGRTGVYLLLGTAEDTGLPSAYIGEGDPIRPRLESHLLNKDFWTSLIAFTSKDENLNKAHVQYLEARLHQIASEAKRCRLENGNVPQLPSVSEADAAEIEGFLDEMLLCFPVLGVHVFEKAAAATATSIPLFLRVKGSDATGYESPQGFVVRAGSLGILESSAFIPSSVAALRQALIAQGILVADGPSLRVTQDYSFDSPSAASATLLGRSSNGRTEWKTAQGVTLKEIQQGT